MRQPAVQTTVMASTHTDQIALRPPTNQINPGLLASDLHNRLQGRTMPSQMSTAQLEDLDETLTGAGEPPSNESCQETVELDDDQSKSRTSTSNISGRAVAPFMARHVPDQYAPRGGLTASNRNPNTKYCYRHRPDLKCRRTADEPLMENLQRVCSMRCAKAAA